LGGNGFGGQEPEDPDPLKQVINDLKIPDRQRRNKALDRLMHTPVDAARREEIAKQVSEVLRDPDQHIHTQAAKVLAFWGGKENTPAIVEALRGSNFFFRSALLEAIAAIKDPAAAEDVALAFPDDKERAGRALIAMGSAAEPAVIKLLNHPDLFVRTEACKVLKFIGTKQSIRPLEDVYRRANGHGFDADAAKAAAQAIGIPPAPKRSRRS
jgi:HEAT repeat protein